MLPLRVSTLFFCLLAFACGSVPVGYLIGRAKGMDIRLHGSKNIGATNVGRVLGRPLGFACFALDFLKGFVPVAAFGVYHVAVGRAYVEPALLWAWLGVMVCAALGHMYTPWLGFKGGKGVATGFGALVGVWPIMGVPVLAAFVVWALVLRFTRYMSLASMLAACTVPAAVAAFPGCAAGLGFDTRNGQIAWPGVVVGGLLAALVVFKHRANIARLLSGTELRVGGGNKPAPTPVEPPQVR